MSTATLDIQRITVEGIKYLLTLLFTKRRSEEPDPRRIYLQKLDELAKKIDAEIEKKNGQVAIAGGVNHPGMQEVVSIHSNEEGVTNTTVEEVHSKPPQIGASDIKTNNVATACLPCTRSHLHTVAGLLKEALRFAREEGVNHPEVVNRLDAAAEELAVLERVDLAPENIRNSPEKEKQVINTVLPEIRRLRQEVVNNITDASKLEETATKTVELNRKIRELSYSIGEAKIDWERVKMEIENNSKKEEDNNGNVSTV